jgi:ATP synthase protein I
MVRAPSRSREGQYFAHQNGEGGMSDNAPDPERLRALGKRLDEAQQRGGAGGQPQSPPTSLSIAFRFGTEMVAALLVGGGLGWGMDWLAGYLGFHTKPVFLIVMVVLGAAAGIRNVMSAANELNARMTQKGN